LRAALWERCHRDRRQVERDVGVTPLALEQTRRCKCVRQINYDYD
jgi:hypothetical protein